MWPYPCAAAAAAAVAAAAVAAAAGAAVSAAGLTVGSRGGSNSSGPHHILHLFAALAAESCPVAVIPLLGFRSSASISTRRSIAASLLLLGGSLRA